MFLWILALWVIDIPIRFHVPNVSKCNSNECLSVRTFGKVCELAVQIEIS